MPNFTNPPVDRPPTEDEKSRAKEAQRAEQDAREREAAERKAKDSKPVAPDRRFRILKPCALRHGPGPDAVDRTAFAPHANFDGDEAREKATDAVIDRLLALGAIVEVS